MEGWQTVTLESVTVFWSDIGIKEPFGSNNFHFVNWWEDEVRPWMDIAIKGDCNPHEAGVWFAKYHDAQLFRARWSSYQHVR